MRRVFYEQHDAEKLRQAIENICTNRGIRYTEVYREAELENLSIDDHPDHFFDIKHLREFMHSSARWRGLGNQGVYEALSGWVEKNRKWLDEESRRTLIRQVPDHFYYSLMETLNVSWKGWEQVMGPRIEGDYLVCQRTVRSPGEYVISHLKITYDEDHGIVRARELFRYVDKDRIGQIPEESIPKDIHEGYVVFHGSTFYVMMKDRLEAGLRIMLLHINERRAKADVDPNTVVQIEVLFGHTIAAHESRYVYGTGVAMRRYRGDLETIEQELCQMPRDQVQDIEMLKLLSDYEENRYGSSGT